VRKAVICPAFEDASNGFAEAVLEGGGALDVVADVHAVHCGDPGRASLPGPVRGVGDGGLLGGDPPPDP